MGSAARTGSFRTHARTGRTEYTFVGRGAWQSFVNHWACGGPVYDGMTRVETRWPERSYFLLSSEEQRAYRSEAVRLAIWARYQAT